MNKYDCLERVFISGYQDLKEWYSEVTEKYPLRNGESLVLTFNEEWEIDHSEDVLYLYRKRPKTVAELEEEKKREEIKVKKKEKKEARERAAILINSTISELAKELERRGYELFPEKGIDKK